MGMKNTETTVCPYCVEPLSKKPKRKTKCPLCKNDIHVRTKQKIFSSTLLTSEDAMAVDWLKKLEYFGITDKDFLQKKQFLSKKFGEEAKSRDVIWGLFNGNVLSTKKDLHALHMAYYYMALFLNQEGRDCFKLLQESARAELMSLREDGFIKTVRILTAGRDSCEACQRLENKVFNIEEALKKMPIPCEECTYKLYDEKRGFCRCTYISEQLADI